MLVYLRIDIVNGLNTQTAYNSVVVSPAYLWRYTNYAEGVNFFRTYIHRSKTIQIIESLNLGIF